MIPWEAIEAQARDTAFQATVITGVACGVGLACIMSVWALRELLKLLGLYRDFISFTRYRRKRR